MRPGPYARLLETLALVRGNPASAHSVGQAAKGLLEEARAEIAGHIGRLPAEVIFTSGATEAMNTAILGPRLPEGAVILANPIEHACALSAIGRRGAPVEWLPLDGSGRVDTAAAARMIGAAGLRMGMLVVMAANNETGVVEPVAELAAAARAANPAAVVVSDAAAYAPAGRLAEVAGHADLLAIAVHKLGGPAGIGVLVRRSTLPLDGLLTGGAQEYGVRAGTAPAALAASAAAAIVEVASGGLPGEIAGLRDRFEERVLSLLPGLRIAGAGAERTGVTCLLLPGLRSEDLLFLLDEAGVAASSGAACASGALEPSHVLLAMGFGKSEALSSLRFSYGYGNTASEIDYAAGALAEAVEKLGGVR